jgi:hypothetical protein
MQLPLLFLTVRQTTANEFSNKNMISRSIRFSWMPEWIRLEDFASNIAIACGSSDSRPWQTQSLPNPTFPH